MTTKRRARSRVLVAFTAMSVAVLATGCASTVPQSGFLSDYSHMQPVEESAPIWNYIDRGQGEKELKIEIWVDRRNFNALADYNRVLVEPLAFELQEGTAASRISPDQLDRVSDAEREDVCRKLGERYTVVEQPGEGVVRLRSAVTKLLPQRAYTPPDRDRLPEKAYLNSRPGEMTTEFELADSLTGDQLAACVIHIRGSYLEFSAEKDIYAQPIRGLRCVASFLRFLMDQAHGRKPVPASHNNDQAVEEVRK